MNTKYILLCKAVYFSFFPQSSYSDKTHLFSHAIFIIFAAKFTYMSVTQELAVNFNDTKLAYRYKTTSELKQAEWMFRFLNTPVIGALGKSGLKLAIQLGLPVKAAIKATLYKQFVGGETLEGCLPIAEKLAKFNVMSILDYSEEGKHSEADFEHAFNELYSNVKFSATHDTTIFAVFKPTAFISSAIMEKISEGKALNSSEEASWEKAKTRFDLLCKTAFEHNYRIMIDAEEYYTQEAIDELTYSMMAKYNKEDIHVINTYQMYRHDRLDALKKAFDRAKSNGYKLGAKLVRGAYMEKERARAIAMNYPDPINSLLIMEKNT